MFILKILAYKHFCINTYVYKTLCADYFYLSKAFDCVDVDHEILIEKLNIVGLRDKEQLWISSCFKERFQRTNITNYNQLVY